MKNVTEDLVERARQGEPLALGKALHEEMSGTSARLSDVVRRYAHVGLSYQLAKVASVDYQLECDLKRYSRQCLEANKSHSHSASRPTETQGMAAAVLSLMNRAAES